jgi:A/G-specific adenine glycosylase
MQSKSKQRRVVSAILRWYAYHGRKLPWRLPNVVPARLASASSKRVGRRGQAGNITNQYRILISEIMLQQTQVSRVLVKYPEFLRSFPTMRALASARQRDVVLAWRGMGYNSRAVRLHKLAQVILTNHSGKLPPDHKTLTSLPGIGNYTANAILSSVHAMHVPIVDVNVRRVLSRLFWKMPSIQEVRDEKEIWSVASDLLPRGRGYRWNQALMDLGATICTARQPRCARCPVGPLCASRTTIRRTFTRKPKREPSFDGIPNRVYRGRIVEALRGMQEMRLDRLGKQVCRGHSQRHRSWLRSILLGLQRDGLVDIRGNGSPKNQLVSLA